MLAPPVNRRGAVAGVVAMLLTLWSSSLAAATQTRLRVNYVPILDVTPMFVAIDKGYFSEEGLVVEPTPSTGGAAGIPGLMAGAYDIMYSNIVSTLLATQQGFALKIVAPATKMIAEIPEGTGLVSRKTSAIKNGKDLEGKTVAINTRNGAPWLYTYAWIKMSGGDPAKVNFKEVPFPQMLDALRGKQVDAIFVVDPYFTNALGDASLEMVVRPYSNVQPGFEVGQYVTTADGFNKNSVQIQKFYRALAKGIDWYNDNLTSPDTIRIITSFTKIQPEVLARQTMRPMPKSTELAQLVKTLDWMKDAGLIKTNIDVRAIVDPTIAK